MASYAWYLGYGSNLCKERFLCYIAGRKLKWAGREDDGCVDKTPPLVDRPFKIPYLLYFANQSSKWEDKGVSFISPDPENTDPVCTYGRLWKITNQQLEEIWKHEGKGECWYNKKLQLGKVDGTPVVTFTNEKNLEPTSPGTNYLRTMVAGLKETFNFDDKTIIEYLQDLGGIKGNISRIQLSDIFSTLSS